MILDVALEDGSGLDLLPELSAAHPHRIPALVFSAQDIEPASAVDAEVAITKSRSSLLALVEEVRRLTGPPGSDAAPPRVRMGAEP